MKDKNNKPSNILLINANLKYIEFILKKFDTENENKTLKEIRLDFESKFNHIDIIFNQHFGIIRLLPLILIKEENKNNKLDLIGDVEKVKIIRDAVAHNHFNIDEKGYTFNTSTSQITLNFKEFMSFIYKIENEFYSTSDPK